MEIPVYTVKVPEYKLKRFRSSKGKDNFSLTPWFSIKIPKAYIDSKPDFAKIGAKIDKCLKRDFLGMKVAIRALSSSEHKGRTINQLIRIIKKLGHDRYDPNREGDRYKNLDNKHIDFFALEFKIKKDGEYFKDFLEPFYFWPIHDRGYPTRIDLAIIYDPKKLKVVKHRYKGRKNEIKNDGYVFRNPQKKTEALLGIMRML